MTHPYFNTRQTAKLLDMLCVRVSLPTPPNHSAIKTPTIPGGFFAADFVVATGDYHHIEKSTLPKELRNYTDEFWDKQTMSPSSLLFFIGRPTPHMSPKLSSPTREGHPLSKP
jgi:hypothetical protein